MRNAQRQNYVETHFKWYCRKVMLVGVCLCIKCRSAVVVRVSCKCLLVCVCVCVVKRLFRVAETVIFYSRSKGLLIVSIELLQLVRAWSEGVTEEEVVLGIVDGRKERRVEKRRRKGKKDG